MRQRVALYRDPAFNPAAAAAARDDTMQDSEDEDDGGDVPEARLCCTSVTLWLPQSIDGFPMGSPVACLPSRTVPGCTMMQEHRP